MSDDLAADAVNYLRFKGIVTPTYARTLQQPVEGTGQSAIVVIESAPWASTNPAKTARYPSLTVNIYADCSRDSQGNPIRDDAPGRAMTTWRKVDNLLHDLAHAFPLVISCARTKDPETMPVPESDHGVLLSSRYAVVTQ